MYELIKPLILKLLALEMAPMTEPVGARHDSVLVYRASPAFLRYRLTLFSLLMLLGLPVNAVVILAWMEARTWPLALLCIGVILAYVLIWIFNYFVIRTDYELRTYLVTDRSLRIRQGAFFFREMTLTFANIQNVKITQGPVERLFGIRNLVVETAGGGSSGKEAGKHQMENFHEGNLRGIDNAEMVRDLIRRRMEKQPELAAPEIEDQELNCLRQMLSQVERLGLALSKTG